MHVNTARILPRSAANGPGDRFVVWVQGCPFACTGCWNQGMWRFEDRVIRCVEDLAADIAATNGIEGVTFTGGEPFMQADSLAVVAQVVRELGLSVFVFTGFDIDELDKPGQRRLLKLTDVVVAGRYIEAQRTLGLPWRGSANQQVHFLTTRYGPTDMLSAVEAEFHIGSDGTLAVTGFPAFEVGSNWDQRLA